MWQPPYAALPGTKNESNKVSKLIGSLNKHGCLAAQIIFSDVREILDTLGEAGALTVLHDVEKRGAKIRNPTAYIKSTARRAIGKAGRRAV